MTFHHFFLAEAEFSGAHAVNLKLQGRVVDILRNVDVVHTRHAANLTREVGGDPISRLEVLAAHLQINGRGKTLVQDGVLQASRLEEVLISGISSASRRRTRSM